LEGWIEKVEDGEVKRELEGALEVFKAHKND